ncbi:MAG: hypothetical protein ACRD2G_15880, partial [Terriglobia bacterium]
MSFPAFGLRNRADLCHVFRQLLAKLAACNSPRLRAGLTAAAGKLHEQITREKQDLDYLTDRE